MHVCRREKSHTSRAFSPCMDNHWLLLLLNLNAVLIHEYLGMEQEFPREQAPDFQYVRQ